MEKNDNPTVKEIVDKWAEGGFSKTQTFTFIVTFDTENKWPILFHHDGDEIEIEEDDLHDGVKSFVKKYGLNQVTLWNTYRECGRDISVSKIRRDVK